MKTFDLEKYGTTYKIELKTAPLSTPTITAKKSWRGSYGMGWQFPPVHMPGADTASTRNTGSVQRDYRKLIRMDILHTFMTGKKRYGS